jgi:hypothetical protein
MATESERRLQVVVAVIGVGGALFGALIGGAVTIRSARDQLDEARQAEARKKRAGVYAGYLNSSNRLVDALDSSLAECEERDSACAFHQILDGRIASARTAYQAALNSVFVYGSDRANRAAGKISALVPSRFLKSGRLSGFRPAEVDSEVYARAYLGFQRVMCREVSADPRAGC